MNDDVRASGDQIELQRAYAACRRMQRRHDPTFYWATRRLPAGVRPAVHAVYGYVRGADEIVDGRAFGADAAGARARLDAWQLALRDGRARGRSEHPVLAALVDAEHRHGLPLDELDVYMDSMRLDCGPVRIASRDELDRYMNGSAASVGRIMAPLLGVPGRGEQVAVLGVGFQLTNFIRDVREDWAMDRVYLPGLSEHDVQRRPATERLRERVAGEVVRARALFGEGRDVLDLVSPAVRPGMRLALAVYESVLDRVERIGFDVVGRRATLTPWEVVAAVGRGARTA